MITDKNTLKSWFRKGLKPLETNFADWIDSYWHKTEQIPTSSIQGLENTLNQKAEMAEIVNLRSDLNTHGDTISLHKTPTEQSKLDRLDATPDVTYATKEELQILENGNTPIVIPVDFSLRPSDTQSAIADLVTPYFIDGSVKTKNIYLLYLWKDDYQNPDRPTYQNLVGCTQKNTEIIGGKERTILCFNSPIKIQMKYSKKLQNLCINIDDEDGEIVAYWGPYERYFLDTISLTENGDGVIDASDPLWAKLYEELRKENHPQVLLKTKVSEAYCPASYEFIPIDPTATPITYKGKIEISYLHDNNGSTELWIESRVFDETLPFRGMFCQYQDPIDIKKFPLGQLTGHYADDLRHKTLVEQDKLNHLATNPNATYATKEELRAMEDGSPSIIIPVDFSLNLRALQTAISDFINPYFIDGSIQAQNVYLCYIWKDDYLNPASPTHQNLIRCTQKNTETIDGQEETTLYFNSPIRVADTTKKYKNFCTYIYYFSGETTTYLHNYEPNYCETINLTENGDGILNGVDNNWQLLYNELNKGNHPQVLLKTEKSGIYCPASYEFTPITNSVAININYKGRMEISYLHTENGTTELWIESRIFDENTPFCGIGCLYQEPLNIKKIPCTI